MGQNRVAGQESASQGRFPLLLEAPDARLRELEAAAWDFYTVLAPACPTPADCRCYVCTAVRHLKAALDRAKGAV